MNDDGILNWLRAPSHPNGEATGFFADLWPAEAWILHAMYEDPTLPPGLTHDEKRGIDLASGVGEPVIVNGVNLDEAATVTGGHLGKCDYTRPTLAAAEMERPRRSDRPRSLRGAASALL